MDNLKASRAPITRQESAELVGEKYRPIRALAKSS
jgi:hypothetical protein